MISVLIVDDEKLVRNTLQYYIDWPAIGVDSIYTADNGAHALPIMESHCPAIVISDVKMPHMNGIEFATLVRERFPHSRLIFLSGYSDKVYLKSAIHLHADAYIEKPIDLHEISETIQRLVEVYKSEFPRRSPELYFYRGDADGTVLNEKVFELPKTILLEIGSKLKSKELSDGTHMLRTICRDMRFCEKTSPDYIRSVYSKLGFQVESAADFHGAQRTKEMSERFIFSVANYTQLSELEKAFLQVIELLGEEVSSQDYDAVVRVNEYVQKNYSDSKLSVEGIAHSLNFNTSYLCALYKKRTGRTINAALTSLRIEQACELLIHTQKKFYEIGAKVGYPNGKYFTKVFAKEKGMSPREYRERHT